MTTPKIKTLKNGVQIITQDISESKILNLDIFVSAGYRDENKEEREYTHLLEHLMMGGSKNYPTEKEMAIVLEKTGSELNAQTSAEYFGLIGETLTENWRELFDLMFDKLLNPKINQEAIDKEIKVLNTEYYSQTNNRIKWLERHLLWQMFPKGNLIIAPFPKPYKLKKVKAEELEIFWRQRINPNLIKIICVGNIKYIDIEKAIEEKLNDIKMTMRLKSHRSILEAGTKKVVNLKNKNQKINDKTTDIRFAFLTVSGADKLSYALDLISSYLGRGYQSRLFEELRLKNNLIYSHISKNIKFVDTGIYYFGFATKDPLKIERLIKSEFKNWLKEIDEKELERLKNKTINQAKHILYASQKNLALDYGWELIINKRLETLDDYIQKIKAVSLEDIRLASRFLSIDKAYILRA